MRARRENNIGIVLLFPFFPYFLVKLFFRKYRLGIHIYSIANKKLPPKMPFIDTRMDDRYLSNFVVRKK